MLTLAFIEQIGSFLEQFGALAAIIISWLGFLFVRVKKRSDWKKKVFMQQVNFSLNDVDNNTLILRTLLEESAVNVFLSDFAVEMVIDAAKRTTVEQPFIAMRDDKDMDYLRRAVLNVVSEKFSEVYVARSMGVPVKTANYVFGITCEKYGELRTQKLRVMLIAEDLLKKYFVPGASEQPDSLDVVLQTHKDRITTLKVMGKLYTSKDAKDSRLLGTMELGIASPSASRA